MLKERSAQIKPPQFINPNTKPFAQFISISSLGSQLKNKKANKRSSALSRFSQSYILLWVNSSLLVSVVGQLQRWADCCLDD